MSYVRTSTYYDAAANATRTALACNGNMQVSSIMHAPEFYMMTTCTYVRCHDRDMMLLRAMRGSVRRSLRLSHAMSCDVTLSDFHQPPRVRASGVIECLQK